MKARNDLKVLVQKTCYSYMDILHYTDYILIICKTNLLSMKLTCKISEKNFHFHTVNIRGNMTL